MGDTSAVTHYDPQMPPTCAPPPAPGPATAVKQEYQVAIPFASTTLSMGVSAGRGGMGASLTTAGSVLVDTCGPIDLQSVQAMSAQTLGSMAVMSLSGTMVGTVQSVQVSAGAMIKVWAGAGLAPGACGKGSAGGTPPDPKPNAEGGPAAGAETVVNAATGVVSVAASVANVAAAAPGVQTVAAAAGAVVTTGTAVAGVAGKQAPPWVGAINDTLGAIAEAPNVASGVAGAVAAIAGGAAGVAGSAAGPGGGATKVDIQGPSGIHMTTNSKITGSAANAVEFKAGVSWGVKVAGGVELPASAVSVFALYKVYMRGIGEAAVTSMVAVEVAAPVTKFAAVNFSAVTPVFKMAGEKFTGVFGTKASFTSPTTTFTKDVKMSGKLQARKQIIVKNKFLTKKELKVMKDLLVKDDSDLQKSSTAGTGKTKQVGVTGALST